MYCRGFLFLERRKAAVNQHVDPIYRRKREKFEKSAEIFILSAKTVKKSADRL